MKSSTKWILRTIGAAALLMPVVIYVVLWSAFREARTREEGKTAALISNFHKLYNAGRFRWDLPSRVQMRGISGG